MSEAGLSKLEQPDFTASARAGIALAGGHRRGDDPAGSTGFRSPRSSIGRLLLGGAQTRRPDPRRSTQQPEASAHGEDEVMALTDTQVRQLRAKLDGRHVKTRKANGTELHYVEGWHVIAEANRIFGYDAWDRRTLATNCVSSSATASFILPPTPRRFASPCGPAKQPSLGRDQEPEKPEPPTPGEAHELALKGAETDATKRALATFGNPFGLALYDREQFGVRKCRGAKEAPALGPWILRTASGSEQASFEKPSEFAAELRKAMSDAKDIELLFAIWEQNVETVRAINRS